MAGNKIGDLKVGIGVESTVPEDLKATESAFHKVAKQAKDAGQATQQGMGTADKAIETVGVTSEKTEKKNTRAVNSMARSVKRFTTETKADYYDWAAAQAGITLQTEDLRNELRQVEQAKIQAASAGHAFIKQLQEEALTLNMTRKELLEYRAQQMGVRQQAQPMIDKMFDTSSSFRSVEMSAKQTRQAMRLLPAQITDVVTSLASGMPIYLVAIQQGGQLRDSFGGFGNVLKGVLSLVSRTVLVMSGLAAVAGVAYLAYSRMNEITTQLNNALLETGNAAGVSFEALKSMSSSVSDITGTQTEAAEALALIVRQNSLIGKSYEEIAEASIAWSKVTGKAISDVVSEFATIAKDPQKALEDLSQKYNFLTNETYRHIQSLINQGNETEAVNLLINELSATMATRAPIMAEQANVFARAWTSVKNAIDDTAKALDKAFGQSIERQLQLVNEQIKQITEGLSSDPYEQLFNNENRLNELLKERAKLEAQQPDKVQALSDQAEANARTAETEKYLNERRTESVKILKEIFDETTKFLKLTQGMNLEIGLGESLTLAYNNKMQELVASLVGTSNAGTKASSSVRDVNKEIRELIANYQFESSLIEMTNQGREIMTFSRNLEKMGLQEGTAAYRDYLAEFQKEVELRAQINQRLDDDAERKRAADEALKQANQTVDQMSQFAVQAARNIESTLGNTLYSALKGTFDNTGKAFADMILKMAADLMASQIGQLLFGNFGNKSGVGGLVGQIAGAIGGAIGGSFGSSISYSPSGASMIGSGSTAGGAGAVAYPISPYATGGYTGAGSKYEPAGIVHRGEYVISAERTKEIGIGNLDRLHKGYAEGGYVGSAASASNGVVINIKNEAGSEGYKATAQVNKNQGGLSVDVIVRKVIATDLRNNGQISQQMGSTFGLRRTM